MASTSASNKGETHALMGPNGSGKSTLANTIMGNPAYEVTEGKILVDGEDITEADPDERAQRRPVPGLPVPGHDPGRLGGQLPAHGGQRRSARSRSRSRSSARSSSKNMDLLKIDRDFTTRYLNEGFSGGEKKRAEILQLAMLEPRVRGARRDRLGPRHRRAAHRRRRRERAARSRDGRADHHPLHAHPRLREAGLRPHHARRQDRPRAAAPSSPTSSRRRATTSCARRVAADDAGAAPASSSERRRRRARGLRARGAARPGAARASGRRPCATSTSTTLEPRRYEPGESCRSSSPRTSRAKSSPALVVQRGASVGARRARPRLAEQGVILTLARARRSRSTPSSCEHCTWQRLLRRPTASSPRPPPRSGPAAPSSTCPRRARREAASRSST